MRTPQGDRTMEQTLNNVSANRMDRAGNPVLRKVKDEQKLQPQVRMMLRRLDQQLLDAVSLPADGVAVGATWKNVIDSSVLGLPYPRPCKVVSTFAEIKTVDRHKCAVIQSKLTPSSEEAVAGVPDIAGNAEVQTLFDVDGGFSRNGKCTIDFRIGQTGQSVSVEETFVLDSVNTLPPEEFARESKVIRAIDAAIAAAYDGEYDKAVAALEGQKSAEVPEAWKDGINETISALKQIAQLDGKNESVIQK
jgi:hypothetical protein